MAKLQTNSLIKLDLVGAPRFSSMSRYMNADDIEKFDLFTPTSHYNKLSE